MRQALAGDQASYNAALTQAAQFLRSYLIKRLHNKSDVDDVLQEVLISLHKARHTYDGLRPFKPWAFAIAHYRLQDYLRKHYHDPLRGSGDLNEVHNKVFEISNDSPITYESINEKISQLPGKQSRILQLLHQDGYTAKEAGVALGMKETAVKVSAHRAYKFLRKKLAG